MAYEGLRNVVILFGGASASAPALGDTWAWDGAAWTQQPVAGPPARRGHAMVWARDRGVVVLFGGENPAGPTLFGDTWEWNGASWTQRSAVGPSPRSGHALAYDDTRRRVVLFGGQSAAGLLNDTWEWDGVAWSLGASDGPTPRRGHAMAASWRVEQPGLVVLFGGEDAGGVLGDTWTWDGSTWTATAGGPPARSGHSMGPYITLFGGRSAAGEPLGDTWRWGGEWIQAGGAGPSARSGTALAIGPHSESVLFGGVGASEMLHDTWVFFACYANCDGSTTVPILNVSDYICFLNKYARGDTYANCDNNIGVPPILNVNDFICFTIKYSQGCP
jgi:hypothetical protein